MRKGTITRRMTRFSSEYSNLFKSFYHRADFKDLMKSIQHKTTTDRFTLIAKLCRMFESCGIACEPDQDLSYYQALYNTHTTPGNTPTIPTFVILERRILKALFSAYSYYPSPTDFMLRLVNRLSSAEDLWTSDTLRVRILKQFIKYGHYLSYTRVNEDGKKQTVTVYGGKTYIQRYIKDKLKLKKTPSMEDVLKNLDDAIFDCLLTADRMQRKPSGCYGLLKLVDDLANSKFRTGSATKEGLYLFAIVYSMTYNVSQEADGAITIFDTDIEKNLFRDYYTSNMLRWISDTYRGKECEYEKDPSGQGINFRNFAEMIYLYYITRTDLEPHEKIAGAHEMISRVKNSPQSNINARTTKHSLDTMQIKAGLFDPEEEEPLTLPEAEFEQYILSNYNCHTGNLASLQVENQQQTAFKYYNDRLTKIRFHTTMTVHSSKGSLADVCKDTWFFTNLDIHDPNFPLKHEYQHSPQKVEEFISLLKATSQFIESLPEKPVSMSRTKLIAAHYYCFILDQEEDPGERMSFEEVFSAFRTQLNKHLEESNYQPLEDKNFFDILIVFAAYARQVDL